MMTGEGASQPPGTVEVAWFDESNRFEVFFDRQGRLVRSHHRTRFERIPPAWLPQFLRLCRVRSLADQTEQHTSAARAAPSQSHGFVASPMVSPAGFRLVQRPQYRFFHRLFLRPSRPAGLVRLGLRPGKD
jgi:hypothetical protein